MVEVLRKTDRYRIECKHCHSLLAYDDEYDELGWDEYEREKNRQVEDLKSKHKYGICFPIVLQDLYVMCPICNNKVITSHISKYMNYNRTRYGEKIER